jgi:hypothetical protein
MRWARGLRRLTAAALAMGCGTAGVGPPRADVNGFKGDLTVEGEEMKGFVTTTRDAMVRVRRQH